MVNGGDFRADLGAADDGGEGAGRIGHEGTEVAHLLLQQEAGDGGEEGGDTSGRGVRAVGGAERIVHVETREPGEGGGETAVIRLLLGVEAQVLKERHLAGREEAGHVFGGFADTVLGEGDGRSEELGQPLADRHQAEIGIALALWASEVGADEHGGSVLDEVSDGRERLADAGVVGDGASIKGHVQVGS